MAGEAFHRVADLLEDIGIEVLEPPKSTTSTVTSVGDSASTVTLLSALSGRLGASFYNTSSADLYLKLGASASTSDFTVKMVEGAFYELPSSAVYTGVITGVWASDADGACLVTELT
jgi:hypothetical protein